MRKFKLTLLMLGIVLGFISCNSYMEEPELTKIEITKQATKVEYYVGDVINTEGMEITAFYSDDTTKLLNSDEYTVTGFDSTAAVESQPITVTFKEQTATFNVKIIAVELTGIEITTKPTQQEYFVGATAINLAGLKVTATYNNGTTADVTANVTTTGFNSAAATENQVITVSYNGKTVTFTIKIKTLELTGIAITTEPTRKIYFVGNTALNLTGMVVTATYNNGTTSNVTADVITSGFDSSSAVDSQTITVTYNGKTATFNIKILANVTFNWYNTPVAMADGTNGSYGTDGSYVLYGIWPQDIVSDDDVDLFGLETSTDTAPRGNFTYVKGLDGNYYVKCAENGFNSSYKYSDGTNVKTGGTTYRWFKAMPIKWRVADTSYTDADGVNQGKLLVAESVLISNIPFFDTTGERTIGSATIKASNYEHSQVRAYLNGIAYQGTSSEVTTWVDKGFLQSAFSSNNIVKTVKVDNTESSTVNCDTQNGTFDPPTSLYICENTLDKIFLLSVYEVTKYSKSTEKYNEAASSRVRKVTDFALANKGEIHETSIGSGVYGSGSSWQLRSPSSIDAGFIIGACVCGIDYQGITLAPASIMATCNQYGIVPALVVSF